MELSAYTNWSCTPTWPLHALGYRNSAQTKSRELWMHSTISLKVGPIIYFQSIHGSQRSKLHLIKKIGRKIFDDVTCKPAIAKNSNWNSFLMSCQTERATWENRSPLICCSVKVVNLCSTWGVCLPESANNDPNFDGLWLKQWHF